MYRRDIVLVVNDIEKHLAEILKVLQELLKLAKKVQVE